MNTRFVPKLSFSCPMDWNGMEGDDKKRFCERCQLHVHNLSAMSPEEREALLSEKTQRRCVAYVTQENSIQVRSGTWLFIQRVSRSWRAAAAALAMLLPGLQTGCATSSPPPPPPPTTQDCKTTTQPDYSKMTVGVVPMRPLWQRILFFWEW